MTETARLSRWVLKAERDGYEMSFSGRLYRTDEETWTVDFMRACAEGLRAEGFTVGTQLEYETVVRV